MSKQDKILNAISKCLTKVKLSEEEIEIICNLKAVDYLEYSLSIDDISLIKKWCKASQRHLKENREAMNLDYGHHKSDAKEGQMAKRALLTMAKDMYNLYCTLNDGDDLPEWCHYKLANSRKDLSDITDYITSKIMKKCVDNNMSHKEIRLEIKKSLNKGQISESFFDKFKNKKSRFNTEIEGLNNPIVKLLKDLKHIEKKYELYLSRKSSKLSQSTLPEVSKRVKKLNKALSNLDKALHHISYKGFELQDRYSPQSAKKKSKSIFQKLKSKIFGESFDRTDVNIEAIYNTIAKIYSDNASILSKDSVNSELMKLYREYKNTYNKSITQDEFFNSLVMYIHKVVTPKFEKIRNLYKSASLEFRSAGEKRSPQPNINRSTSQKGSKINYDPEIERKQVEL